MTDYSYRPTEVKNPFRDLGAIADGDRFFGREKDVQFVNEAEGSLAIIGLPRIGKSSLVHKAIIEREDDLLANKRIPIWLNVGEYENPNQFFSALVELSMERLISLGWQSTEIEDAFRFALEDGLLWGTQYRRMKTFFERVRQAGNKILFVLDDFDYARHLFKDNAPRFMALRELYNRPSWRVNYITISRRPIAEIETKATGASTFSGVMLHYYVRMFNDIDMQEYFKQLSSVQVELTAEMKERIDYYGSTHPFFLAMIGHNMAEMAFDGQQVDIDKAAQLTLQTIISGYDHLIELLREDGSLHKLLQVLFGPVLDVDQSDVNDLLRYDLIYPDEDGQYKAFSRHFGDYLKFLEREVSLGEDLWPIWRETEKALRRTISATMLENFGPDWIRDLEHRKPNSKAIFDECRKRQSQEERSFGGRASPNLIDFTYPRDLFTIAFWQWEIFQPIFGHSKDYWEQQAQLLSKVRTPMAHNRDESLHDYDLDKAEGICKEILALARSA